MKSIPYSELRKGATVTIFTSLYRRPKQTGVVTHIATAKGDEGVEIRSTYGTLFLPKNAITKIVRAAQLAS